MHEEIVESLRRGDVAAALGMAQAAVAAAPDDPEKLRLLALALGMNGDSRQAHAALDRAMAFAPVDSSLHYQRATLLMAEARVDEAQVELNRTIGADPNELRAYVMQAQIALGRGDLDEAERLVRLASRVDPNHAWLLTVQGMVLLHRKQLKEAHALLMRATQLAPDALQTRYALGLSFLAQDHLSFAEQAFRAVVEKNPAAHGVRHMLADVIRGQGRHAEAAEVIEAGLVPNNTMPSDLMRYAGELWLVAGNHGRALPLLKRAVAAAPGDRATLDALIEALRRNGDAADARNTLEAALATTPHIDGLWSARLSFEPAGGDIDGLAKRWQAAIPESVQPLHVKMWQAEQQGDKQAAKALAERIIELEPGHIEANSQIINQLFLDDPPAAVAYIQALLPNIADPQTGRMVLGWLGRAQDRAGQYADAVDTWTRLHAIASPQAQPLPASSGDATIYPPIAEPEGNAPRPVFLFGPSGSGVERVVSTLLHNARSRIGIDRTSLQPPHDPFQYPQTALRLSVGELDGATVVSAWRATLASRGLDESSGPIDWLPWWDNALLHALRNALPEALVLFVLCDPRDMLVDWLQRDSYIRYDAGTPMRIAVWLAHVLEQVATVAEGSPVSNRVVRIDEIADDAAAIAAATGQALGMELSPAPALGPGRFASRHWRNYAEALAGPFAALNAVARRLGYPDA